MGFKEERSPFAGGFRDVVSLVEYDDAVLDDLLVVGEEVGVEEVVVRHDEQGCEVLRLQRVEVGTEVLRPPHLLHDLHVQQGVGQLATRYPHHLFLLLMEEAGRLHELRI